MKLTTSMVLIAVMAVAAAAQNPATILQNTKNNLNAAEQKKVEQENAALDAAQSKPASKPAAGTAAPTAKPLTIAVKPVAPAAKPALVAAKPAAPAAKPAVVAVKPAAPAAKPAAVAAKPAAPAAKPAVVAAKPAAPAAKPAVVAAKPATPAAKPAVVVSVKPAAPASGSTASSPKNPFAEPKKAAPTKIAIAPVKPQPPQGSQKVKPLSPKAAAKTAPPAAPAPKAETANADQKPGETAAADSTKPTKMITAEGRRDPFLSPIVSRNTGPNCSTGKRCLAIDQIMVRGVVKSESGMIAVVVNSLNKAYFLKENDPVYNGYVLKITGDSVVFKETFQDRLGKESTREVVKKITTPAV
jgi:hypothetical protein